MSSNNIPAILSGNPVRPRGDFRTTPEVSFQDVAFVDTQILTGDWEPDATQGGIPLRNGLVLPANVRESLGVESAALSAELAQLQAAGQDDVRVVPCNNGTHAIKLALAGISKWTEELGLREHVAGVSEVIVPAETWQATAGAVLRRGLVPVLVDVDPGTLCMDPDAVRAAITDRTVAIIAVHLYDRMADMDAIMKIAAPEGIALIEDCAHAHGARYRGQGAGTIGHIGTFSDQGSKSLSCQEGGFLITKDARLADQLCSAVTCGRRVGVSKPMQADNDRMPGAIAALLRGQVRRFPEQNGLRVRVAERFDWMLRASVMTDLGLRVSDSQAGVDVPPTYKKVVHVDLKRWGGMNLGQWIAAMAAELGCEITTIYQPLVDSPLYAPHTDSALHISDEFWAKIDPAAYEAPVALDAFASVAAIEHAAFLDKQFPEYFVLAANKVHAARVQLAAEVNVA